MARQDRWCQPVEQRFLDQLNARRPRTMQDVERIWYDGESRSDEHYDSSRYHCLNLHSVFQKGTVEFRLFNGTLHAGKIKAYIQFCLAIGAQALNQSCASRRKTQTTNEKYTFRTWLLRLGLNGDEFATARQHLLANLPGCIAWRDPVSYTHLHRTAPVTRRWGTAWRFRAWTLSCMESLIFCGKSGRDDCHVTLVHLDVYKRQQLERTAGCM